MQLFLKPQVDQLTGRNEELRRELRHSRNEYEKSKVELDRSSIKVGKRGKNTKNNNNYMWFKFRNKDIKILII